ncbi:MAG: hypothetical protein COY73_00510 [Candidatus Nealsonbacteria bacterium CG_4_10_14_0_8_um_filter_37_14]|uniref:Antitoxin n=1 Tax=Candidatus Nealsonbacteria bacterium CG_4_10_14_0_8_um_filter_37_14 TaxID=1974684 RepID=A0A2M7R735_9BACT|nr:MAG: hypothetical protein COY73_00510 [Candidatus Nealsonbacteria bacterium CG_4_10_14_0_8_um_filter_37_14]
MANQTSKNSIAISRETVQKRGGMVILPLEEYERMKEDLEMIRSKKLPKEIERARREAKERKTMRLEEVEKKLKM